MISLITVTYNSSNTIRDTFESVLNQTYRDIDYIVIDGCSTDETVSIIKEYELKFEGRFRWISETDNCLYDAMNKGIRMATGDIIGFLNSDDFFTKDNILKTISDSLNDDSIDAVYGDIHFVKPYDLNKCVRYYSSKRFKIKYFRFGFMPAHPSFYVRRWCYEKYGGYSLDYMISSDFDLLVRFLYKYKIRCKYIHLDFVTMRTGGVSTRRIKSRWQLSKEDVKACKKYGIYTNWFCMMMKYLYKIKEYKYMLYRK